MAMVDMTSVGNSNASIAPCSPNSAPTIYLTEEQCEALGIAPDTRAGTEIGIQAVATVIRASQTLDSGEAGEDDGEVDISVTLELRSMSVGKSTATSDMTKVLYSAEND